MRAVHPRRRRPLRPLPSGSRNPQPPSYPTTRSNGWPPAAISTSYTPLLGPPPPPPPQGLEELAPESGVRRTPPTRPRAPIKPTFSRPGPIVGAKKRCRDPAPTMTTIPHRGVSHQATSRHLTRRTRLMRGQPPVAVHHAKSVLPHPSLRRRRGLFITHPKRRTRRGLFPTPGSTSLRCGASPIIWWKPPMGGPPSASQALGPCPFGFPVDGRAVRP